MNLKEAALRSECQQLGGARTKNIRTQSGKIQHMAFIPVEGIPADLWCNLNGTLCIHCRIEDSRYMVQTE